MDFVELGLKIGVEGFLHSSELSKLIELAAGRDVLEVGSFKGLSAWGMGFVAKSLVCCDTFKANSAGQQQMPEFTTLADFQRATRRYNHVEVIPTASEVAVGVLAGRTFDMIFLDAMHTLEDVRADTERWWPSLRPGGVFVYHDFAHGDFPGVEQAVNERFGPPAEGTTLLTLRWIEKT